MRHRLQLVWRKKTFTNPSVIPLAANADSTSLVIS